MPKLTPTQDQIRRAQNHWNNVAGELEHALEEAGEPADDVYAMQAAFARGDWKKVCKLAADMGEDTICDILEGRM